MKSLRKSIDKLILFLAISTLGYCTWSCGSFLYVKNCINRNLPSYVSRNLVHIIKEQEDSLGIKHFGIPNIQYGNGFFSDFQAATYENGIIRINTIGTFNLGLIYTRDDVALMNRFSLEVDDRLNIVDLLNHELGHFYLDRLAYSLNVNNYLTRKKLKLEEAVGKKLVHEGVATYFERRMSHYASDNFKDSDWPIDFLGSWGIDNLAYARGGYHLVKEIIHKHGKKGITYLSMNPPSEKDLKNLPDYQRRAMKILAMTNK